MLKNFIFLIFILKSAMVLSQSQNLIATPLSTHQVDVDHYVGFDGMGNLYYIKNNIFYMKNEKESWQYKNVSMGKPTRIDIQNPLKIMLFYENFNTVIMLDNQLNETQKINFSEKEVPIVAMATGIVSQNRLWIYNSLTQQIGLFNYLKNTFKSITPPLQGSIKYYQSDFNTFQWIDSALNWYSCDIFGKITTLGIVSDFDQIQVINDHAVLLSKAGKLQIQDIQKNSIDSIENVEKSINKFYYKDQILSIFTNQEITNYKIKIL